MIIFRGFVNFGRPSFLNRAGHHRMDVHERAHVYVEREGINSLVPGPLVGCLQCTRMKGKGLGCLTM